MRRDNLFLFILIVFICSSTIAQNKFVGVKTCSMCHKKPKQGEQFKIWQGTRHSEAYRTLQTKEADKIASEKGFKTKAVDTPECLKCHTTGFEKDKKFFAKKFKIEDGVQCEACHGAGSKYKSKKIMQDHDQSVAAGMREFTDKESIEKFCRTCHNSESPTFEEFDFEMQWTMIQHDIPKSKK